jgi:hypothetical protein
MALEAHTKALVVESRERVEDSIIADTLRYFISDISTCMPWWWGDIDAAKTWQQQWTTAADYRLDEAGVVKDVMGRFGTGLIQTAADYAHTDIKTALTLHSSTDEFGNSAGKEGTAADGALRPYLDQMYGGKPFISAGPNGEIPDISYYQDINPDDKKLSVSPEVPFPDMSDGKATMMDRLGIAHDDINYGWQTMHDWAPEVTRTPGWRKLGNFYKDHRKVMSQAEQAVAAAGMKDEIGRLPTAFLDEVRTAWPGLIINRAELFHVVRANYKDMRDSYGNNLDALKSLWRSEGGARAYYFAANTTLKYLDKVAEHADWFAEEGKKAGKAVDALLLTYADVGYEKIDLIIQKYQAYEDARKEACDIDADNILKSLSKVLHAVSSAYNTQLQFTNNMARGEARIEDTAAEKGPDLGDGAHVDEEFPETEMPGENWRDDPNRKDDWWESGGWKPGAPKSTIPVPTA